MNSYHYIILAACALILSSTVFSGGAVRDVSTTIGNRVPQDSVGANVFRRQCAPCHGNEGKGNGPAAVAFNPRPTNLTDADHMEQLSDEELLDVIASGRGSMPAFRAVLSPEDLQAVVEYVRSLSQSGLK